MPTILCLDYSLNKLFQRYGDVINDPQILLQSPVDVVAFPGGPDVPPRFYGAKMHPKTYTSEHHYSRFENIYRLAVEQGSTLVGICGGAQYLCVKAGGKLIQHVENHAKHGLHEVQSIYGPAQVTSTHHQMMWPDGTEHELLSWADNLSPIHEDGEQEEVKLLDGKEPEAVWFKPINRDGCNSLAVQWHPEYMHEGQSGYDLFQALIQNYVI